MPRGFAYVHFAKREEAEKALAEMNGVRLTTSLGRVRVLIDPGSNRRTSDPCRLAQAGPASLAPSAPLPSLYVFERLPTVRSPHTAPPRRNFGRYTPFYSVPSPLTPLSRSPMRRSPPRRSPPRRSPLRRRSPIGRGRSPSRSRSRSPSRSPPRRGGRRSPSRSPSRSPRRSRSPSPRRSPARKGSPVRRGSPARKGSPPRR